MKKDKWTSIVASEFKNAILGESLSEKLIGKKIIVNLMSFLSESKRQNINAIFKIKEIKDNKAIAEIIAYKPLSSYLKRVVRVGIDKVEDSFIVDCKDGKMRVKPYILTRAKVQRKVLRGIRKKTKEFLDNEAKDKDVNSFMMSIINMGIQVKLRSVLNKVYPIAFCEFRIVEKISR